MLSGSALGRCARYGLHQRDVQDALPWDSKSEFASHGSTLLLVEHHLQAEAQLQPLSALADRYRRSDGRIDHDITSHIVFARTTFHLAYCLLNHSFLLRLRLQKLSCRTPPNFLARSAELCLTHARALIELLHDAAAAGLYVQSSFYAYSVAVAGSLLSLGMHEARLANHEPDSKIVVAHQSSLSMLQEIGQVWEHASKMVCISTSSSRVYTFSFFSSLHLISSHLICFSVLFYHPCLSCPSYLSCLSWLWLSGGCGGCRHPLTPAIVLPVAVV